jgi:hypothetical protein
MGTYEKICKHNPLKGNFVMTGISRQQLLILAILLFFAVIILGCLCLLVVPSPGLNWESPAFVF